MVGEGKGREEKGKEGVREEVDWLGLKRKDRERKRKGERRGRKK